MYRLYRPFLFLAVLSWGSVGLAQIRSGTASVTLRARVEESLSLQHVSVPLAQAVAEDQELAPRALVVSLRWALRPGRRFQLASQTERRVGDEVTISRHGPMSLRQLEISSYSFSSMPSPTGQLALLGTSGTIDEDAAGRAVLMMLLPTPLEGEELTVRISIISL